VRASTFVSELIGTDPAKLKVPVVGGHSGVTILPLLSQVSGTEKLSQEQVEQVTNRIQFGGDEVVKAKAGTGSATLSMAFAGARFTLAVLDAIQGKTGVVECTYVNLEADPEGGKAIKQVVGDDVAYFSAQVELGKEGVSKILAVGKISDYEKKLFEAAVPELKGNIVKGASFITDAKL
jgi:malate dehydrogenase